MPIEYRPLARACIRTLTATVLVAASASAFAANLGFLNNTPITYMKQRDLQALNRAAQTALETKKDGESLDWDNKDAGNTVPVHGTITPRETFEDAGLAPQGRDRGHCEGADADLDAVCLQAGERQVATQEAMTCGFAC